MMQISNGTNGNPLKMLYNKCSPIIVKLESDPEHVLLEFYFRAELLECNTK